MLRSHFFFGMLRVTSLGLYRPPLIPGREQEYSTLDSVSAIKLCVRNENWRHQKAKKRPSISTVLGALRFEIHPNGAIWTLPVKVIKRNPLFFYAKDTTNQSSRYRCQLQRDHPAIRIVCISRDVNEIEIERKKNSSKQTRNRFNKI